MIEINLKPCCYDCTKFDLRIEEDEYFCRDEVYHKDATVCCTKAGVCANVIKEVDHD